MRTTIRSDPAAGSGDLHVGCGNGSSTMKARWESVSEAYDPAYLRIFDATFSAGVEAAEELSDDDLERLAHCSGLVGIIAEHVRFARLGERRRGSS